MLAAPAAARAQGARREFSIPAQPLSEALVRFALQAGISIGGGDLGRCARVGRPVEGRFTPAQGLERLLLGSGCRFRAVDGQSFVIEPIPPAPLPPPAPPPPAPAPPLARPAEPSLLNDIVVTAGRREVLAARVPAGLSILAGADLPLYGAEDVSGVAAQFAGMVVTNLGPGRDKVFVRGLSDGAFTGRTQSTVGLYLDDAPITYSAPDPGLLLTDVARVELLRGPQGSLYGLGSIGGVVKIVTNKPDPARIAGRVSFAAAATRDGAPSASAQAMLNLPLIEGRAAIRVAGYDERLGGYINDVQLRLKDVNGASRRGGRLSASADLTPEWKLSGEVAVQSLNSDDTQYVEAGYGSLSRANRVREPHDNDFASRYVTLEGHGGWGDLKLTGSYVTHSYDSRYDASGGLSAFSSVHPRTGVFNEDNQVKFLVGEAVLTAPDRGRLGGFVGVFATQAEQASAFVLTTQPLGPAPLYDETRKDNLHEAALFGELSYALTSRLSFSAGLRGFSASLRTASIVRQSQFADRPFAGRTEEDGLAPKLVLAWQRSPKGLFYLQMAKGYRLGGFNTSGVAGGVFGKPGQTQPTRQYRPDDLWSYEAGAKLTLFQSRLQLQTAVFYAYWRNIQSDQFLRSGLPFTANVGDGANPGFELEAAYRVNRRLTLQTNLLINHPEIISRDPTYSARKDASLPGVPKISAALVVDYRRPVLPQITGFVHLQAEYVGPSHVDFDRVISATEGGYATARLSAGLIGGRWRVSAYVDNPADSRGDTFGFGNPFTYRQTRQMTPLRPRTVGLNLGLDL